MAEPDCGLRRVAVHAETACVDLALPAAVPVAALIPAIIDIIAARAGRRFATSADLAAATYQLSRPGSLALDASMTLAQNAIRDGTVLVLTRSPTELPAPSVDDLAEAVSATLDTLAQPWTRRTAGLAGAAAASWLAGVASLVLIRNCLGVNTIRHLATVGGVAAIAGLALLAAVVAHRAYREPIAGLALGLLATGAFAVAGFLAVPGGPGLPNVLLAAMVAAAVSVLAMRATGCGAVTLTAVSCFAAVIAVVALAGAITVAPVATVGSIAAVVSLGLLEASPRMSIVLTGLAPGLPSAVDVNEVETAQPAGRVAAKAIRADQWLTSLVAAFSSSAAVGALTTALGLHNVGVSRVSGVVFATVTGAVLMLRARVQTDASRMLTLLGSGIIALSMSLVVTSAASPQYAPWIAAGTVMLAAAAFCLGFVTFTMTFSPIARRTVELLEYLALVAIVPLTCWTCGLYSAVRGLNLT